MALIAPQERRGSNKEHDFVSASLQREILQEANSLVVHEVQEVAEDVVDIAGLGRV